VKQTKVFSTNKAPITVITCKLLGVYVSHV
jgi:hypothetical protein